MPPCRTIFALLALLSIPLPAAWAQEDENSAANAQQQGFHVRGTVINSVTQGAIARVLVTLSGESHAAQLSDNDGHFDFSNVPAGQSVVQAWRPGYFADGQRDRFQPIHVGPGMGDLSVFLEPASAITGQILLSTGDAPNNIRVQLMRRVVQDGRAHWLMTESRETNSEGVFRFGNLQKGEYKLFTSNSIDPDAGQAAKIAQMGYPPAWYPEEGDSDTGSGLALSAGQQLNAQIALTHEPFYSVTVPVANSMGYGAAFQILDQNGRAFDTQLSYDAQRQQVRTSLPNGNYTLTGESFLPAPGFGSMALSIRNGPLLAAPLTIVPTQPIHVTIRADFTSSANGSQMGFSRLVNLMMSSATDGNFMGVNLRRETGNTDSSAWVLENARPGKYWVSANTGQGYVASITAGGTDLATEPLTIGTGGASARIDIALRNDMGALTIHLKNTAAQGNGFAKAFLELLPQFDTVSTIPEAMPLTSSGQTIHLPPGTYRVLALDHPQRLEYHDPKALEAFAGKGQTVTLDAGGTASVDVEITSVEESTAP